VLATPPKVSSDWFPVRERTLATSCAVVATYVGTGLGFVLALPVSRPSQVLTIMYIDAGISIFFLLCCCLDHAMYPPLPPHPPSLSAGQRRPAVRLADVTTLLRNRSFITLAVCYGLTQGAFSGWTGVLDPILQPLHFSQNTASYVGIAATVGCIVGTVAVASLFGTVRASKPVLLALYAVASLCFLWFTLTVDSVIRPSTWQLYASCALGRYVTCALLSPRLSLSLPCLAHA
jgi:hypothetical protein